MKAVILAAGEGCRLKPFTLARPKVMIPVGNKPILEYVVNALQESGIIDIVMVVGYKREKIMDYFQDGHKWGVNIDYIEQSPQLGTAHALRQVSHLINDHFLAVNGDTILNSSDIKRVLRSHMGDAAILTTHVDSSLKYGVVTTHNGLINDILEKPKCEPDIGEVNAGVYKFTPVVFDRLESMQISERGDYEITDVIKQMIAEGQAITAVRSAALWMDVEYPWDLLKVNALTLQQQNLTILGVTGNGVSIEGPVGLGNNSVIRSGSHIIGPVCIGDDCDIGPNVVILPNTSIGNGCTIEPFTRISNSILMNNVKVSSFSHIAGSIIGEGTYIGPGFIAESDDARVESDGVFTQAHIGAIVGDNTTISGRVIARPGYTIGVHCRIGPGTIVSTNIYDHASVL